MIQWALGVLFTLILGSYGFTWLIYQKTEKSLNNLFGDLDQFRMNHIRHLEERIEKLEKEKEESDLWQ